MERQNNALEGLMTKMDWLKEIRRIFNTLTLKNHSVAKISAKKAKLVAELVVKVPLFRLRDTVDCFPAQNVQPLSVKAVISCLDSIRGVYLTWGQIIDALFELALNSKVTSSEPSEGSTANEIPQESRNLMSDEVLLDLSFQANRLRIVPEQLFSDRLSVVCLAGNCIEKITCLFPESLNVLNLASNELSEVDFNRKFLCLKLLNLSNNRIRRVLHYGDFHTVKELYFGFNLLEDIKELFCLKALRMLDISYNEIKGYNCISPFLDAQGLEAIRIKGNPIQNVIENLDIFKLSLPVRCIVNPHHFIDLSEFKGEYIPLIPLKWPPTEDQRLRIRPTGSRRVNHLERTVSMSNSTTQTTMELPSPTIEASRARSSLGRPISTAKSQYPSIHLARHSIAQISRVKRIATDNKHKGNSKRVAKAQSRLNTRGSTKSIVITNETISEFEAKFYNNPVKALMICPGQSLRSPKRRAKPWVGIVQTKNLNAAVRTLRIPK